MLRNLDSGKEKGPWKSATLLRLIFSTPVSRKNLPESVLGIDQLRGRLSKVLIAHIASELPSLVGEIESKRIACQDKLDKLGQPRLTIREQQAHLLGITAAFQRLCQERSRWDIQ